MLPMSASSQPRPSTSARSFKLSFACDLVERHHLFTLLLLTSPHLAVMILGQIAWSDCVCFLIFLAPQLIFQIGLFQTLVVGIKALPFLRQFSMSSS